MTDQTPNEMHMIDQIARSLMGSLPKGWREVTVTYRATAPYAELDATVTGADGQPVQVDPLPDGLEDLFETLRLQMYQQGKGAWLTAVITVMAEGRFSTDFDYDSEPHWSIPVSPDTYAADLDEFPREDRHVPEWLRAKVAGRSG
jgi:hypothetical protein